MYIHCLGHFSLLPPSLTLPSLPPSVPGRSFSALITNFVEKWHKHNKKDKAFRLVELSWEILPIAFMYPCVTTHVDSTLNDLYIGSWSLGHDNLCHFKVSVLVPLEGGYQMLSCFWFLTYSYTFGMCSPLVLCSKSNHIAAFSLDLKSIYEGEHTIFLFLSLADLTQNDVALVPSIYLQRIRFHSSLWLSKIPLCTSTTFSWSIHQ
jgi:hypothetical protein